MKNNNPKEKENIFMENLIREYNDISTKNNIRINFTEYIDKYFSEIKEQFENENLFVIPEPNFNYNQKTYKLFDGDEKGVVVSYMLLTKKEIFDYLANNYLIFLYTYKFGGHSEDKPPKYLVWIIKK